MKLNHLHLACCVLLAAAGAMTAQAGGVPPPRKEDPNLGRQVADGLDPVGKTTWAGGLINDAHALDKSLDAQRQSRAIRDFADTTRGAVRDLNLQSSDRALVQGMAESRQIQKISGRLDRASGIVGAVGYVATGAEATQMASQGDVAGAVAVVGQAAAEDVVQRGGEAIAYGACAAAGGPVGGNVCKGVFNGGYALGSAAREVNLCKFSDCGPGRSYTFQDGMTDGYFNGYEKVKFALFPELDPMSSEFAANELAKVQARKEENRRRYESRAVDLRNEQRALDEQRMEAARQDAVAASEASPAPGDGLLDVLNATMQLTLQQQQLQQFSAPSQFSPSPRSSPSSQSLERSAPKPAASKPSRFCDARCQYYRYK